MSCTNVVTMLGTTTVLTVVSFTLVWSISSALHPEKKPPLNACISPVSVLSYMPVPVALLTMPLLSYFVLHVAYAPVA
jgi:hypothetical protein